MLSPLFSTQASCFREEVDSSALLSLMLLFSPKSARVVPSGKMTTSMESICAVLSPLLLTRHLDSLLLVCVLPMFVVDLGSTS